MMLEGKGLYDAIVKDGTGKEKRALELIDHCLDTYGPDGIAFSFNGGKDSTVVLHVLTAALGHRGISPAAIKLMYFHRQKEFPELLDFMNSASKTRGFALKEIKKDFKEGLTEFLTENPAIKAILMGQRIADFKSKSLEEIHRSDVDKGWPDFMRVNPILTWEYKDVWTFLRKFRLEYCCLYDKGYTSLDSPERTKQNDALLRDGEYLPAYLLEDEGKERSARY